MKVLEMIYWLLRLARVHGRGCGSGLLRRGDGRDEDLLKRSRGWWRREEKGRKEVKEFEEDENKYHWEVVERLRVGDENLDNCWDAEEGVKGWEGAKEDSERIKKERFEEDENKDHREVVASLRAGDENLDNRWEAEEGEKEREKDKRDWKGWKKTKDHGEFAYDY